MATERIQKALATAGLASRREIESWIREGRILVNGRPAEIGQKIGAEDKVRVDGKFIALGRKAEATRLLLYRKRVGEVVTRDDPEGRRTIFRKLPELAAGRWITIGRLDINTSGLLLLTNNGELARRLMHPSYELARTYAVRVLGDIDEALLERLRRGVELDDGPARFDSIALGAGTTVSERSEAAEGARRGSRSHHFASTVSPRQNEDGEAANQWFEVVVRQGRNRLVRRLFESQRLQVSRLIRIGYGPIMLGRGIKTAGYREATPAELAAALAAVGLEEQKPVQKKPSRRRR